MFYYTKCFANESAIRRLTLITMSTYFEVQRPRLTHIGNYNNLWILIKMFTFFNSADLRQFSNVSSQLLFLGVQRFKVFATRERILDPKKCRKSSESKRSLSFSNRLTTFCSSHLIAGQKHIEIWAGSERRNWFRRSDLDPQKCDEFSFIDPESQESHEFVL